MVITINELQYYQYLHDTKAHQDIGVLRVKDRLTHLALHFDKYFNKLSNDLRCEDLLACVLSFANVVGAKLDKSLSDKCNSQIVNLQDVPLLYADGESTWNLVQKSLLKISKTLEGLDHIESIDYRKELSEAISELFLITLHLYHYRVGMLLPGAYLARSTLTLVSSYMDRLLQIRGNHLFFEQFSDELDSNPRFAGLEVRVKHLLGVLNEQKNN